MRAVIIATLCFRIFLPVPGSAQQPPSLAGYRLGARKSEIARALPCESDGPNTTFCFDLSNGRNVQLWFSDGLLRSILTREKFKASRGDSLDVNALSAIWLDHVRGSAIRDFGEPDSVRIEPTGQVLAVWDNGSAILGNAPPVPRNWNARVCVLNDRYLSADGAPASAWYVLVMRELTVGHGLNSGC